MFLPLLLAAPQPAQERAVVTGWDNRPTVTIAEGYGRDLAAIKPAAERCGFSRTWIWDDGSDGAQLWVLRGEASSRRIACLNRWRIGHEALRMKWKLRQAK